MPIPRKRKAAPKSTQTAEPPLKIHQPETAPAPPPQYEDVEEEVEEIEVEEEVEEEEEEEAEEEEEEEGDAEEEDDAEHTQNEDDDPIPKLLEPMTKDQILKLLSEAAEKHADVANRIRKVADEDPAHRKIFVHGLGWDTTAGTLISAFREYGEIEDCKAVTDKVSGKSKGYGFILFKTRRGARNALKEPQKKIGNRMTACQLASIGPVNNNATATPPVAAASSSVSEYTQKKIYVSNVGADLDPQKLLAFFSQFGEIEEGPLGLDKVTGKPKGFCLFVYKSYESAKRALEEPHKEFEGNILHCQRAIDGPKPGKVQQQQQQHAHVPAQRTQFQRNGNAGGYVGGVVGGGVAPQQGHLMAPAGPGVGFNQAAAAQAALNPALGQALTALLASQGTLGLTNLLGTIGTSGAVNPGVPAAAGAGAQSGYNAQSSINQGVIGGYGSQVGLQAAYPNPQLGQGGAGRGGQYGGGGGAPYMGH